MDLATKMNRVRLALQDPEVLEMMRRDPQFQEYFDANGKLLVDIRKPGLLRQITEVLAFRHNRERVESCSGD